ncbi:MAG: RNA polymerase sporulation sigma factor SigE [Clostridia bacterium]|nr:RNA polymerase sporulation sigma factor SigE [Clostridia bacterium]
MKNLIEILKESINTIYARYIGDNGEEESLPIFYVAGSQTLPPPLPQEEEQELIMQLSTENNLEARQILVERNLRLVVYIAKKFENTGVGIEDLISIGTIGLMKAVNTFNNEKKIKLATYASRCIENEILMYLRRTNKTKGEISIDEPLNKDGDGNELLLSDILGTDGDVTSRNLEDEVDKSLLKAAIVKLSDREKNIMEMRFGFLTGKEKTQKEVADELGISQSYISRLEKKIINKMRKDIMSKTG